MKKDLTQALSTLSDFGLSNAVESTINEARDKEVQERAHTLINSHLPAIASVNDVDTNQMAKLYNIGGSTEIVANIDVFSNQLRKEAAGNAKLTPNMYNEELSVKVAPYLRLIDTMQGPDKTLAYDRLINGVSGAQGIQVKGNQQYKITEVKNLARANVDNIVKGVQDLPEELQVGTLEEQLDTMTSVWLEKGMPAADISATLTDVVSGIISEGNAKATDILSRSSVVGSMVDPDKLSAAKVIGLKKIDHRLVLKNAPHMLSTEEQDEAIKSMFVDYMKLNPNATPYDFYTAKARELSRFGKTTFTKNVIGTTPQYRLTGNKDVDVQVNKDRKELMKRIMSFNKGGMPVESIIANLTDGAADMSAVVRNIVDGLGDRSFDSLAASSLEAKFKARGVEEPKETLKEITDQAVNAMLDMQNVPWYDAESLFSADLPQETKTPASTMIWQNKVQEDIRKYLAKNPSVDFMDENWAQKFADATYKTDRVGNDVYLRDKSDVTFQENGEAPNDVQNLFKDLSYDIVAPAITEQFDKTYQESDTLRNDQVKITRSTDGNTMNLKFRHWKGIYDRWEDYNLTTMVRMDFTGDEPKFEMLPREEGLAVRSSLSKQQEYFDRGWRPTTPDGSVAITMDNFAQFRLLSSRMKDKARADFVKATGVTKEERMKQSAAISAAFY